MTAVVDEVARAVVDLVRTLDVETPAYVYDLDEVGRSVESLRQCLPEPASLYYSLKANGHRDLVRMVKAAGCEAEVCSPGELDVALGAGFRLDQVLYTGPGKRDKDILHAVRLGVRLFSVDSPLGIAQLDRIAAGLGTRVDCLLRVNDSTPAAGQGLTMTGVASQFGADVDWIFAEPERFASRPAAQVVGLHFYMGTNVEEEDALVAQLERSARTARRVSEACGIRLDVLDLGGGFAAPFARTGLAPRYEGARTRLNAILDESFPSWRQGTPSIAFESGRRLVGTSGTLVTRVLDVKRSRDSHVVVLESGINHLGGMSGLRRLPPVVPDLRGQIRDGVLAPVIVAGPLCTPLDTWARGTTIDAVEPGDLIAVPNVGAYGLSASLVAFLGHPAPVEIAIADGRVVSSSRLAMNRIPVEM